MIQSRINDLEKERVTVQKEIAQVDTLIDQKETSEFMKERKSAYESLVRDRNKMSDLEFTITTNELELTELSEFQQFLADLVDKVGLAEKAHRAIGGIEFTQCPACLSDLAKTSDPHTCNVCGAPTDPDEDRSRYNQIRLDLEMQMRESRQLFDDRNFRSSTTSALLLGNHFWLRGIRGLVR